MRLIRSWEEIATNIRSIVEGAKSVNESDRSYFKQIILRGMCFVVAKHGDNVVFAPSRFIGYANNSPAEHETNAEKDGRDTNPVIAAILSCDWEQAEELEEEYRLFCHSLGLSPRPSGSFGAPRKFIDARDRTLF
jgi:hypothetical protein